jgi:putative flavoprotein involved in K+ transport
MAVPVVVVGAGPAGLATSCELTKAGVEHVVLERGRIGQTWRDRWDSFCLVTPNWTVMLPERHYDGPDPDGFMPRDEMVSHLERYASAIRAPVQEGIDVTSMEATREGGFVLGTSDGDVRAGAVVISTGAFQRPHRPNAADLPPELLQIDVDDYRNEQALPPGTVLVVGSGQSGCQIAEELHEAGRKVVVARGRAPWVPRRVGDRDFTWWLLKSGFLDAKVGSLPSPEARLFANVLATGHGGGHDLHLRTLQAQGVVLAGHFLGATRTHVQFAPDLADSVAWGDERYVQFTGLVREVVEKHGLDLPDLPDAPPFEAEPPEELALSDLGAVIIAGGFRPDYSWLPWPGAFDELGFPIHDGGASTVVPGLYFVGVHFLRKRKSSTLIGVGEDAAIVAGRISVDLAV